MANLYLVKINNGDEYEDYDEITKLIVAEDFQDAEKKSLELMNKHFRAYPKFDIIPEASFEVVKKVDGYNIATHTSSIQKSLESIKEWAIYRGLETADPNKQIMKLGEEYGEVCAVMAKDQPLESLELEIGDMVVALTILAMQKGTSIERCAARAYEKIKDRSGKMINGVYVKSEDLP